jgi:CheY-like chemotaxis protein
VDTSNGDARNETILVVEDAETIRKMVCAMLKQSGYRTLEAGDGSEALDLVRTAPHAIDLILTDVVMPEMGGVELSRRIARIRPELRMVFMSGFSDNPVVTDLERSSAALFLAKPFTAGALLDKVREALASKSGSNSGAGA